MIDDREFNTLDDLQRLPDEELENIVIAGINIHISTSKASAAKRILDNRRQSKQLQIAQDVQAVAKHLGNSNKELLTIVRGLKEIIKILDFLKSHWFPKYSVFIRIGTVLLVTVILGILLNLIADAIAKFLLHW